MTGSVDNSGRAIVRIQLKHPAAAAETTVDAWIDTGFTGELVLAKKIVDALGLPLGPAVRACLADGSQVDLDTYTCVLEWFDQEKRIEVVANEGQFPLVGVGLMMERDLTISYRNKVLSLQ